MTAAGGFGPLESKVRRDVETLSTAHPMGESLAELAYFLARALDDGVEDKSLAAVSRDLRMTLIELARLGVPDDDGFSANLGVPELSS